MMEIIISKEEELNDMLIGEEIINEAMNSWLEKNGFETRIYGLDTDFSWEVGADLIRYSLATIDFSDKAFMEYAYELGLFYEIDVFWFSFLHELGHAETWHLVDEEDMVEQRHQFHVIYQYYTSTYF